MSELYELGVLESAQGLASGAFSAEELTRACLARLTACAGLNASIWCDEKQALQDAQAADAARAAGDSRPLLGIPIAIKDLLNVQGQPCTAGSAILKGYVAPFDATVITRLRTAGMTFPFRTNTDEFAMGGSTETSVYGVTRNPWNPDYVPGGSSGGSAAAVAAMMAPAAVASDSGGSIRQPASFCGITGLKPTYGRVSRFGCTAFASSLDQIGPMARTVEDAALIFQIMAGQDSADSTTSAHPIPDFMAGLKNKTDLKGLRIGLPKEYFTKGVEPDVEKAVRTAVAHCETLGASIIDVELPHSAYGIACYYVIAPAEASANMARFDGVRYGFRAPAEDVMEMVEQTRETGFGAEVKRRIILGTYVLSSGFYDAYYLRAQKVRTLIRRDFEEAFQKCDILMGPVGPTPAFRIGERSADPLRMYLSDVFTANINLAGNCALSVPCGSTAEGLPIGLHMIAPAFEETRLLETGAAFQHTTAWHQARPSIRPV